MQRQQSVRVSIARAGPFDEDGRLIVHHQSTDPQRLNERALDGPLSDNAA